MTTRTHIYATTAAILLAGAALTACSSSDDGQGTAERASSPPSSSGTTDAADDKPAEKQSEETELAVGDTFRYKDGVRATVTKVSKITPGQDDYAPEGKVAFRITWTMKNETDQPLQLDGLGYMAAGAEKGSDADIVAGDGAKHPAGRLAPGKRAEFAAEYALPRSEHQVAFTLTRTDDAVDVLADDPVWTGDIT